MARPLGNRWWYKRSSHTPGATSNALACPATSGQRSTSVTANPRRASSLPATRPVTPAPTMAIRRGIAHRMREMGRRPQMSKAAALVVGALLVLAPNLPSNRVPSEDEGVFLYVARTIAAGGMPYRDVWDHKPPGVYLLDLLTGVNVWGVFVLQGIALAAAIWPSYPRPAPRRPRPTPHGVCAYP